MSHTTTTASQFSRLDIEGMHCAACVSRLEKVIGRQTGVLGASVNLASESALIEHTADWQPQAIIAAIHKAGFEAHQPAGAAETRANRQVRGAEQEHDQPLRAKGHSFLPVALSLLSAGVLMAPMLTGLPDWPAWLQFLLCTPVQFGSGAVFLRGALGALRTGQATMDVLVTLGSLTAWAWSTYMWASGAQGHLFYEASASVIAFVLLGKWLEKRTRDRTAQAISGLSQLRPDTVEKVFSGMPDQPQVRNIPLDLACVGDVLRVNPATRVACDGEVISGHSHVDESALTGEPIPLNRGAGDTVRAGTLNIDGVLFIRVTQTGEKTLLGQVIDLIEKAQGQKLPAQALADRIAAVFVPIVLLIALLTGTLLYISGVTPETALMRTVTILVIACPCALGLATPAAIIAGTGAAARAGLLIRDPRALHVARSINTIIFDKTGTLTVGQPTVSHILRPEGDKGGISSDDALQIAAALQAGKTHPLGHALLEAAKQRNLPQASLSDITLLPGIGMSGWQTAPSHSVLSEGHAPNGTLPDDPASKTPPPVPVIEWLLCNPRHAASLLQKETQAEALQRLLDQPAAQTGTMSVLLAKPDAGLWALHAAFTFNDAVRPQAAAVLSQLKRQGHRLILLSGDRQAAVDAISAGLPLDESIGECSPADKAARIQQLQREGRCVAMVGDGVNDAPAMAVADLAMAMGGGTDIAAQTAHITLMNNQLSGVPGALDIAHRIHRNIAENLFWAFAYNTVCIPLAALGWFNPMMASAAMALSSVSVVANALRLSAWKTLVRSNNV